jgi:large subunit ribosomal protein L10
VAKAVSPAEDGVNLFIDRFLSLCLSGHKDFLFGRERLPGGVNMPNAKVLSEKQAVVAALVERIKNAGSGVLVDYKGINVAQDTELRAELRKNDVEYSVIKNTLTRFALDDCGMKDLDPVLHGTTALATSTGDPIAPFRIISDYSDKLNDVFNIKAAFMDGKILSDAEIKEISALPSKDALYSQVFGTLLAPITSLAVVLNQIAEKNGAAPAAEAPAAE